MSQPPCAFCDKLSRLGELPDEEIVWQFAHSVAFLGPWQFYDGYCVLVLRRHATELSQLSADERRGFLDEMCLLAQAIEVAVRPIKMNYELLGNQVAHIHWHLIPRRADDPSPRMPVWTVEHAAKRLSPLEVTERVARIRAQLS